MVDEVPKVAVIGYGAMARSLAASLESHGSGVHLGAVLVPADRAVTVDADIELFRTVEDLIAWQPALVVECASHEAVRGPVVDLLAAGIDVVVASIGAMADDETRARLERAAEASGGRLSIVSGAIGGLDILRSARLAGLENVTYVGRKPPGAWLGTPAETLLDLKALREPAVIFEGSAAEAAALYPKNANVTAAVALAGIGFHETRVTLVADPNARGNSHNLIGQGAFGSFEVTLENNPLPDNPKTSWLAALSVEQAVLRHFQTIEI